MARRTEHVPVNDFQRWFEAALERRGIGLRELADKVETDYSHLWKIVRGNSEKYATSKRPGYELTIRIGEALNDVNGAIKSAGFTNLHSGDEAENTGDLDSAIRPDLVYEEVGSTDEGPVYIHYPRGLSAEKLRYIKQMSRVILSDDPQ